MVKTNILQPSECRKLVKQKGCFAIVEYVKDASVTPMSAAAEYYAAQMNVRKRQVVANLSGNAIIMQAGAMQFMTGSVEASTNVNGVGDMVGKLFGSRVTGESAVKPKYQGVGTVALEPTYKHILFEEVGDWGGMVLDDGLFLACEDTVGMKVVARSTLSSAVAGGEGLFNTCLTGRGVVVLESPVPREELIIMELTEPNDVVKIDGNMAIAWSESLRFTVERTTKTLIGSAATGEGLVNVYRGVGKILMAPVK